MIKETYIELLTNYSDDNSLKNELWEEIEQNYLDKKRHYHTLSHLENLLKELLVVKNEIKNWETILFTLFYHDIIYNSLNSDNEEQSAEFAEKRMNQIHVPAQIIANCKNQILATKKHLDYSDLDTKYFIDADLSILGQQKEEYKIYQKNVRLEYLYYPSVIFNKGRIQVLRHFLNFENIYKTEYFKNKYEEKARENLKKEIENLEKIKDDYFLSQTQQWCFSIEDDGDFSEFLYSAAELLDNTTEVERITYYPGFFDSGYYRFYYKKVKLHLEWEGMLGVDLRTEPNPTDDEIEIAKEVYEILKQVRNKNYA